MAQQPGVISRWHLYMEEFQPSAQEFYASVEVALGTRAIPKYEAGRILRKEGGLGSPNREYLRVAQRRVAFDICASTYGEKGYFFSWWFIRLPPPHPFLTLAGILFGIPVILALLWLMLGKGCFASGAAILAGPVILLLLGKGVQDGMIGDEDDVLATPVIGWLYAKVFNPQTFYRFDTDLMFQEAVRASVNEVIARIRDGQGMRALSNEEWRPHLQSLGR